MANDGRAVQVAEGLLGQMTTLLNPFWGMLPRRLWKATKDYFVYSTDILPFNAATTQNRQIPIQADSHFMIIQLVQDTRAEADDETLVASPSYELNIFDSGSGRSLSDNPQHIANWLGTILLPNYLAYPKVIKASSTLTITATNLTAATDYRTRISLLGFKIFPERDMPVGSW